MANPAPPPTAPPSTAERLPATMPRRVTMPPLATTSTCAATACLLHPHRDRGERPIGRGATDRRGVRPARARAVVRSLPSAPMAPTATSSVASQAPATAVADPLGLGALTVWPPVVLAPMAGVTNVAFRALCRRFGGGLYVSEMVGARGLVEGDARSQLKAAFGPGEQPRSIQLYATDPADASAAVRRLTEGDPSAGRAPVDHLDLNFGCPAPKVTRHGGGA